MVKFTKFVKFSLQITCESTIFTWGEGLTVTVNVCAVPVQVTPAFVYDGVTVIVATWAILVVFKVVKDAISPVPFAAIPIESLLIHMNV